MNPNPHKVIINITSSAYQNLESFLKNKFKYIKSNIIEINCDNVHLKCEDISLIRRISNTHGSKIINFCSTNLRTIISAQSLGYRSEFIPETFSDKINKKNDQSTHLTKTHFHRGTLRSGEYLDSPGDLLILGDVNPGAIVSAEGDVFIWGKLLGIAHAGSKGNSQAKIAALQLQPVQLRIADKVARGPQDKPLFGLAEQARIHCEKIIISPLEKI